MADLAYLHGAYLTSQQRGLWHLPARGEESQDGLEFNSLCGIELAGTYIGGCGMRHPRLHWSAALPLKQVEEAGWKFCSVCVEIKETGTRSSGQQLVGRSA